MFIKCFKFLSTELDHSISGIRNVSLLVMYLKTIHLRFVITVMTLFQWVERDPPFSTDYYERPKSPGILRGESFQCSRCMHI